MGWSPQDLFDAPSGTGGSGGCDDATADDVQGCVEAIPDGSIPSVFGKVFSNFWDQFYGQALANWPVLLGFFVLWIGLAVVVWLFRWFRKRGDDGEVIV